MIADQIDAKRAILLMLISMVQVFAIIFMLDHKRKSSRVGTRRHVIAVLEEAVSTYAVALSIAAYFLWTFGTLNASLGFVAAAYVIIVAGFVTSLGAAAAEVLI